MFTKQPIYQEHRTFFMIHSMFRRERGFAWEDNTFFGNCRVEVGIYRSLRLVRILDTVQLSVTFQFCILLNLCNSIAFCVFWGTFFGDPARTTDHYQWNNTVCYRAKIYSKMADNSEELAGNETGSSSKEFQAKVLQLKKENGQERLLRPRYDIRWRNCVPLAKWTLRTSRRTFRNSGNC